MGTPQALRHKVYETTRDLAQRTESIGVLKTSFIVSFTMMNSNAPSF